MSERTTETPKPEINVSKKWEEKFELFEKIDADDKLIRKFFRSPAFRELDRKSRNKLRWNDMAIGLGPFYYFLKRMWLKGAVLLGVVYMLSALLALVGIAVGIPTPLFLCWLASAFVCGQLGNYDYYRHVRFGDKMWSFMPAFLSTPMGATACAVGPLLLIVALSAATPVPVSVDQLKAQMRSDMSGIWTATEQSVVFAIDLRGETRTLSIGGMELPGKISIENADLDNHILTLRAETDGEAELLVLRQVFDETGTNFQLTLTLDDGTQHLLSFVRNLQ